MLQPAQVHDVCAACCITAGVPVKEIAARVTTVQFCLSKVGVILLLKASVPGSWHP